MNNHILVFCDRQGNERFFLRRKATTPDIQRYLLCFALWAKAETPWANSSGSCVSNHYEIPLECDSACHGNRRAVSVSRW